MPPIPAAGIMPGDLPGTRDPLPGGMAPVPQQPPLPSSAPSGDQGMESRIAMAGLLGELGGRVGQAFDQTRGVPTTQPIFDLGMSKAYLDQAAAIQKNRQRRRQEDLQDAHNVIKLNQDLTQQGAPIRFVVKGDGTLGVQQITADQALQERQMVLRRMAFDAGVPIPPGMDVMGNQLPPGPGAGAPPQMGAMGLPGAPGQAMGIPGQGQAMGGGLPPGAILNAAGGGQSPLPPAPAGQKAVPPAAPAQPAAQGVPMQFTIPQPYGLPPKVVRAGDPEYAQMAQEYVRLQRGQQDLRTGQQVQEQNDLALEGQRRQADETRRMEQNIQALRTAAGAILKGISDETGAVSIQKLATADRRKLQQGAAAANREDPVGALVDAGFTPDEAAEVMGIVDPVKASAIKETRNRFDKAVDDLQKAVSRKVGAGGIPVDPSPAEVNLALQALSEAATAYNASLPKEAQFDVEAYVGGLRRLVVGNQGASPVDDEAGPVPGGLDTAVLNDLKSSLQQRE